MASYIHRGKALYLTADKQAVVEEGDPKAAFLLVGTGGSLTAEEAGRWGLEQQTEPAQPTPTDPAALQKEVESLRSQLAVAERERDDLRAQLAGGDQPQEGAKEAEGPEANKARAGGRQSK